MAQTTRRLGPSMLMGVRNHHRCICEQVGDGGVSRRISDHSSSRRVLSRDAFEASRAQLS